MSRLARRSNLWFGLAAVWMTISLAAISTQHWFDSFRTMAWAVITIIAILLLSVGSWKRFVENLANVTSSTPSSYVRALASGMPLEALPGTTQAPSGQPASSASRRRELLRAEIVVPLLCAAIGFTGSIIGAVVGSVVTVYLAQGNVEPPPAQKPTNELASTAPAIAEVRSRPKAKLLLKVYADRAWQDTGVMVQAGELVDIGYFSESWHPWPEKEVDGRGCINDTDHCASFGPDSDANISNAIAHGGLIASVGEGATRPVGNATTFVSAESGNILLRMNDLYPQDNSGFINVGIFVWDEPNDTKQLRRVHVKAEAPGGVTTGFAVVEGETITLGADGEWCWGEGETTCTSAFGTSGRPTSSETGDTLYPDANLGQLVIIVAGETIRYVGETQYVMPASGLLILQLNDRRPYYYDNTGTVTVDIERALPSA